MGSDCVGPLKTPGCAYVLRRRVGGNPGGNPGRQAGHAESLGELSAAEAEAGRCSEAMGWKWERDLKADETRRHRATPQR